MVTEVTVQPPDAGVGEEVNDTENYEPIPKGAKVRPRRVASDDCRVVLWDEETYPHVGEWVELLPIASVRRLLTLRRFTVLEELNVVDGEYVDICRMVADHVVWWNWTDASGSPMPQPHGSPEVIMALEPEEILWLIDAAAGRAGADRKNGSSGLPGSS